MITKRDISKLEGLMLLSAFEEGSSKRKVAASLNLSMDTLNKYLSDLEQNIGAKLLASNGRGSILTSHARSLLKLSKELKMILRTVDGVSSVKDKLCGTVRVGMSSAVSSFFKVEGISGFFEKYPEIKIESIITEDHPNMQLMDVDVGISYSLPAGSDLVMISSQVIPCGLYASKGYLERYGKPQNKEELFDAHRFCGKLQQHNSVNGWNIKGWKDIFNQAKKISYISNSNEDLLNAVRNNCGISLMPCKIGNSEFVRIDTVPVEAELNLYLIAHRHNKDVLKIRTVINFYKELLQKL